MLRREQYPTVQYDFVLKYCIDVLVLGLKSLRIIPRTIWREIKPLIRAYQMSQLRFDIAVARPHLLYLRSLYNVPTVPVYHTYVLDTHPA